MKERELYILTGDQRERELSPRTRVALSAGEKQFETEIDGKTWTQPSFPYQLKCLNWTRERYQALQGDDLKLATSILEAAGLMPLVEESL